MKRTSLLILSLFIAQSSLVFAKSMTSSNVAAFAAVCKETSKFTKIKDTPLKGLLFSTWLALTWFDSAETFVPKTRAAFKSLSPSAWLQVAHAASAAAYMTLSLTKSYKKYKGTENSVEGAENPVNEFKTTDLANNVCAAGSVILASTKSNQLPKSLKESMAGIANTLQVYPDVEYVGTHTRNAWQDRTISLDMGHALSATAFMVTTLLTRGLRVAA